MNRQPTTDEIAARAYELYCERGRQPGNEAEDWLRAERELVQRYTLAAAPVTLSAEASVPAKTPRARGATKGALGLGRKRLVNTLRNSLS